MSHSKPTGAPLCYVHPGRERVKKLFTRIEESFIIFNFHPANLCSRLYILLWFFLGATRSSSEILAPNTKIVSSTLFVIGNQRKDWRLCSSSYLQYVKSFFTPKKKKSPQRIQINGEPRPHKLSPSPQNIFHAINTDMLPFFIVKYTPYTSSLPALWTLNQASVEVFNIIFFKHGRVKHTCERVRYICASIQTWAEVGNRNRNWNYDQLSERGRRVREGKFVGCKVFIWTKLPHFHSYTI